LYPFVPDSFSKQGLKNVQQVLEDIREMEICGVPKNLGYIPNLFEARRKQSREEFERMGAELTQGHVHAAFTNKAQFTRALAARKSVFEYHNADYREIQEQFLQVAQSVTQELRA
jgi:cellulose biosynthesis protein BcsQ